MRKIILPIFLLAFFLGVPSRTHAVSVDIGFNGGTQDIFFSNAKLVVGDPVRIYASVHNFGDVDVSASVLFYQGAALIDEAKPVSIRAQGLSDEVYVDWIIPDGAFNIRAEVKGQKPTDQNPANDTALTSLLTAEKPVPPPPTTGGSSGTPPPPPAGGSAGLAKSIGSTKTNAPPFSLTKDKEKGRVAAAESEKTLPVPSPVVSEVSPAVNDLLKVYLDVNERSWNTFDFTADANRSSGVSYEWSFGDGKTAQGKDVQHAYMFAGRYVVSVVAVDANGERAQEKATLDISFWNLGNWQLWLVLLFLIGFAVLLLGVTRRKREGHPEERSAAEEGETPPVLLQEEERGKNEFPEAPIKKKRKASVRNKKKPTPPESEPPVDGQSVE